jgi:hypothetical protein
VRGRTVDEPEQKAVFSLSVRPSLFSGRFYDTRTTRTEKESRRKNEKGSARERQGKEPAGRTQEGGRG